MKHIWKYIQDKVMSFGSYLRIVNGPFAPKEDFTDEEVKELIDIIEQDKEEARTRS